MKADKLSDAPGILMSHFPSRRGFIVLTARLIVRRKQPEYVNDGSVVEEAETSVKETIKGEEVRTGDRQHAAPRLSQCKDTAANSHTSPAIVYVHP